MLDITLCMGSSPRFFLMLYTYNKPVYFVDFKAYLNKDRNSWSFPDFPDILTTFQKVTAVHTERKLDEKKVLSLQHQRIEFYFRNPLNLITNP